MALRKAARLGAAHLTKVAGAGLQFERGQELALVITFIQPDRRARDRDNLLAAWKPMLDGVADALGVNDSQFEPVTIRREYGRKPGAVRIEISEHRKFLWNSCQQDLTSVFLAEATAK